MKICHVSLARLDHDNPVQWLETIPYFIKIQEALAKEHDVMSFHNARVERKFARENVMYHFSELKHFAKSIRFFSPDVIILHGWHSIFEVYRITTRFRKSKIFIQHHGERVFRWPKSFLQGRIDKNITGYFFSSRQIGDAWIDAGLIGAGKAFEVFEVASPFSGENWRNAHANELKFLWVGRLDENKDPLTLIDGFIPFSERTPNAKLRLIFKEDKLLSEVKNRIKGFETKIELIGRVSHDQMKQFYLESEFIVSTSLFEAGGVSVLEGISMGCIPILSDIPSFRTITDDGKVGILFPPRSPEGLTNAFQKAVEGNRELERERLTTHFENKLSQRAIAAQIISVVGS
jgi:glycosyltransferase involved in cell wall biosynthesis